MTDAARFRDSTQIILPKGALSDLRAELQAEFTLTVVEEGDGLRIVGSPVEIRSASEFLSRRGVNVP